MDRVRTWTAVVFLFIFADAVAMQARGPILSSLEGAFRVSEAALGLVAPAETVGFLVAVVATRLLAGRINVQRTLFLGTVVTGCALLLMAAAPVYVVFLLALLVQGAAAGAFRGGDRVVLSHLHADRRGRVFTAYTLVWAVGAVLGPQLVSGASPWPTGGSSSSSSRPVSCRQRCSQRERNFRRWTPNDRCPGPNWKPCSDDRRYSAPAPE